MDKAKHKTTIGDFFSGLDLTTLITAIIASTYGLSLVYSATLSSLSDGSRFSSEFKAMFVTVAAGIVIAVALSLINYEVISKLWPIIAAGCIVLMIITFFFGKAPPGRPDAKSWLDFKYFTIQTSELMKVGFIISFSYHLDLVKDKINKIKTIIPLVIHGAIPVALVVLTGDAGSALIFLIMFIGMLFFAKIKIGYFIAGICTMVLAFVIAWETRLISGIQRSRIEALFYPEQFPDVMYQQNNGKIAIGSGGMFGQGFMQGKMTQTPNVVPENQNDMILTVAGEEFGFIGAMAIIILLAVLILRIIFIALKARDNVGYLMCMGVSVMLFAQVLVNVGMELSLLPCIGITLPLFSSGGSSSLSIYLAIGVVLSVYRYSKAHRDTLFYAK